MRPLRKALAYLSLLAPVVLLTPFTAFAQTSAGSGATITGVVVDSTNAAIPNATVVLQNPVAGFSRTEQSDATGHYTFTNVPFNPYTLYISSPGFATKDQRLTLRSSVPAVLSTTLPVASAGSEVTVEAGGELVENSSTFHVDIEREQFAKLPLESVSSSVSSLLTLESPGVSADSNGLFHGLGDHAENAFYIDGQPVTDQQSKVFSNQLPIGAIQSLEVISGAPPAEYGEKTSLVANVTTRSGQGITKPRGEIVASYGTFGSSDLNADLAAGTQRLGNFTAIDLLNTGRFLDPAEFAVFHAKGNSENFFDRFDTNLPNKDALHTDFQFTRSWFQTPNDYDNLNIQSAPNALGATVNLGNTDQRTKIQTVSVSPFFTHTVSDKQVVTLGTFVRRDAFNYYPSKNAALDFTPQQSETISQSRSLLNAGARVDDNYVRGGNNIKFGASYQQTFLNENFNLGLVNPFLNAPCVDATGNPVRGFTDPTQCAAAGLFPNTAVNPLAAAPFNPLLGCLDLTRPTPSRNDACAAASSTPFNFLGHTDVKLLSLYAQDAITVGHLGLNVGLRGDIYNGLAIQKQAEPRVGVSYAIPKPGTVVRASYARTMETPFNENLVLSSKGCNSAVISALVPCIPANFNPGFRNEFHAGLEQSIGKHIVINGDYLWKYTHNGYDFSVLGATPITFPIEWHNSKISGFALRTTVPNYKGFTAFVVMSSVAARFFPPQIGGLGATNTSGQPFRIDHDEKFNQTTNVQYQYKRTGPYFSANWRFDSGQVAGAVPYATSPTTAVDLTGLTADEQLQAGLLCGTQSPTFAAPLTTCAPNLYHSSLVSIPKPGTENDDHNPPRIAPRNLFDLSLGEDSVYHFRNDHHALSARVTVTNLTNKVALYNFLSTFSGTHYVSPRTLTAEVGFHF